MCRWWLEARAGKTEGQVEAQHAAPLVRAKCVNIQAVTYSWCPINPSVHCRLVFQEHWRSEDAWVGGVTGRGSSQ